MKATLYYFSGTGNSLKVAEDLANEMGDTSLISIPQVINKDIDVSADRIGIVFPVYIFGMPLIVSEFINKINVSNDKYIFAVATFGGILGNTLLQTKKELSSKGLKLSAGFAVQMPGNYTPLYGAKPRELQEKMFLKEKVKVKEIAGVVMAKKTSQIEKGFFLTSWLLSLMYKFSSPKIPIMDKNFWADDKCNSCGICEKVCPVKNIKIIDGKPQWQHKCEQCFACLHWCPQEAIQFKKSTIGRKRYRHPEIKLEEMIIK